MLCKFTSHFLVQCKCCRLSEELVSVCFQISGSRNFDANEEKQKVREKYESELNLNYGSQFPLKNESKVLTVVMPSNGRVTRNSETCHPRKGGK